MRDYFSAQQTNRASLSRLPAFQQLVPLVDSLYVQSVRLVPKDALGVYGQVLLVCHNSFLSASALIVQAQPHDAAPITRRAIEAIRLTAAVKSNHATLDQWHAYEKRLARWQARQRGERPPRFSDSLPVKHPLVHELMDTWGMLSDASVHFTPEYLIDLSWSDRRGPGGQREVYLNYFVENVDTMKRDLVLTTGSHAKMLRVLDWCWDSRLSSSSEWRRTMDELYVAGQQLSGSPT